MEKLAKDFVSAVFDTVGSALGGLWGLLPWEAQWGLIGAALVALAIVIKVLRDLGGWPLVGAFLLGAVAIVSGSIGFDKGRKWAEARKPVVVSRRKRRLL